MNTNPCYCRLFAMILAIVSALNQPVHASARDDKIVTIFLQSYVNRTYLKDDAVAIDVKDGVVTLSGTVSDESHKRMAQEIAASLPGVSDIDNRLMTKAQAAAETADGAICRKLKLALLFHRSVIIEKTLIEVSDGLVTLKGHAASESQKKRIAGYAGDIEGVRGVQNQMTVELDARPSKRTSEEKLDDPSVIAHIRTALWLHPSTRSIDVKVDARNGNVTLSGVAHNLAEKSRVTLLVADLKGVKRVTNEMTIGGDRAP